MATPNRFNLLARLFTRTKNPVIGELYTHVLNTPLFVEPVRGEALLNAFIRGHVDQIYSQVELSTAVALGPSGGSIRSQGKSIAVLNISGALVSRPMPGPSGAGPLSYEEIKASFDAALEDPMVGAIVFRMDSPGGFVSGCFDLADHIFESRGTKPIVAVVDDMAYSAAYALASACDEIWMTRTGGVGSVGAIAMHEDESESDKQLGVKVTAIFSGAHKNDFSRHEPLSDSARDRLQAEVDRLREMFVESVSRYRSLKADDVRATEALTYHGQAGIDVGFADRMGTFEDAIAALQEQPETPEQKQARMAAEQAEAERVKAEAERLAAEAAEKEQQRIKGVLAAAVAASSLPPNVATAMLGLDVAEADVEARIKHAEDVVARCATAKLPDLAVRFIQQNTSIDDVGKELLERKAEIDRALNVDAQLPANISSRSPAAPTLSSQVYKSRREQVAKSLH